MHRNNSKLISFSLWNEDHLNDEIEIKNKLLKLGIDVDSQSGHLSYTIPFQPLLLNFDLVFIRHGETYGNCGQSSKIGKIDYELVENAIKDSEQRIYQGNVDSEINQLTDAGLKQATEVAEMLKTDFLENDWIPEIILVSPLSRAKETALPFISQNQLEDRCFVHEGIREMSFGSWDNRRVCDMPSNHSCHLFYQDQNALIKNSGLNGNGDQHEGENFCQVILRACKVMQDLNENHAGKKIVMFSHSMFGAACCILLGKGQQIENGHYLAFDGKRNDGSYYTMPNAKPFVLNFEKPLLHKKLK